MNIGDEILEHQAKREESRAAFRRMIEKARAEMEQAEELVRAAINMRRPRLSLHKDDRAILLCRSTYGEPFRITDFDQHGAIGHRDYRADDLRGMAQEIASAIHGGFTIRH